MTVDDNDVDDEVDDGFDDEIDNGIDGTADDTTEETEAGTETVTPDQPTKRPKVSPEEIFWKHTGSRVKLGYCSIQINNTQQYLKLSRQGSKPSGRWIAMMMHGKRGWRWRKKILFAWYPAIKYLVWGNRLSFW
jgi:hypothetical protein